MSQPSIAPAELRPPDHHDEIAQLIREIHEERQEVRDLIGAKDGPLSNGVAALQVAIALASVCLIVKRKLLWAASGAFGAVGISYVIKGLLL